MAYARHVYVDGVDLGGTIHRVGLHLSASVLQVDLQTLGEGQRQAGCVTRYGLSLQEAAQLLGQYVLARERKRVGGRP